MSKLTQEDFYYGALLSLLINKKAHPALFDDTKEFNRKIYEITLDNNDAKLYCKYASKTSNDQGRWAFSFTENETRKLQTLLDDSLILTFVCSGKKLKYSEVAFVKIKEHKSKFLELILKGAISVIIKSMHGQYNFTIKSVMDKSILPLTFNVSKEFNF